MIRSFIIRLAINIVALYVTALILPVFVLDTEIGTLLLIGAVFGILNAIIKPVVKLLTCPLTILTLGLFSLVINAGMLLLTARIINDPVKFSIDGFWTALIAGIIMGITAILVEFVLDRIGLNED